MRKRTGGRKNIRKGESVKGAYIWAVQSIQGPENVTEAIAHSQISGN
jgi:hypothetical protein